MIIACSSTTIQRIKEAVRRRIAKGDGQPLVVENKTQLASLRKCLKESDDAGKLVWNLHLTETEVHDGGTPVGTVVTGYLYQRECRLALVMNSLDDTDLCRIGDTVRRAIRCGLDDCFVNRRVSERYLLAMDSLTDEAAKTCELVFHRLATGRKDHTIVIPNSDRKAASGITQARTLHEGQLFGSGHATISHEFLDRSANYKLNNRLAEYGVGTDKRKSAPCVEARPMVAAFAADTCVPTVELELKLISDGFTTRHYKHPYDPDVPECQRTVRIPLDSPLSWVHGIIQKTFNWYDYHLHRFSFLDYETRELFDLLLQVEFGVHDFMDEEPPEEKRARFEEAGGLGRLEELTGLGAKWLYRDFAPYAEREIIDEESPTADLPEDAPIGLHLFGEENYRLLMENLTGPKMNMVTADIGRTNALYYNYDFGDDWELSITATRVTCEPADSLPRVVDGAGHTPPEDCGGIGGFQRVISAFELTDDESRDEARKALRERLKSEFPPELADEYGPDLEDEIDHMLAEEIKEAEDTMRWARGVVGWFPFSHEDSIEHVFDRKGRMW